MSIKKSIFWNVDTQKDFMEETGKLYVQNAEEIYPVLKKLTDFAKAEGIRVINTCDYHYINSEELSSQPDYNSTFPPHCMAGSTGAEFIRETDPESPLIIDWDADLAIFAEFDDPEKYRNVIIRKNAFDVFAGNHYTEKVLQIANPDQIFVYGVATNVCVDKAAMGLAERGLMVYVIQDAIKELPDLPLPFEKWRSHRIEMISFDEIVNYL